MLRLSTRSLKNLSIVEIQDKYILIWMSIFYNVQYLDGPIPPVAHPLILTL
jgi:hypothetical protein